MDATEKEIKDKEKDLKRQIAQYERAKKKTYEYAKKFMDDLNRVTLQTINNFYEDYTPLVYHRNRELFHAYQKKIEPFKENGLIGYRVTFEYSPDFMEPVHNSDECAYSFAMYLGYHGNKVPPQHLEESLWDSIAKYAQKYKIRRLMKGVIFNVEIN